MDNLRDIVPANILYLRKQRQMTQIDLAKLVNFSDKAISRWEKGEVLPDLETLQSLAKIFDVPLTYLLEPHNETDAMRVRKPNIKEILFQALLICGLWTMLTVFVVYADVFYDQNYWQGFLLGIPITCLIVMYCNRKYKNKLASLIASTILNWSTILCIYMHFISYNPWMFFLAGVPIQAALIVLYFVRKYPKS